MKSAQYGMVLKEDLIAWSYIEITTQICAGALWLMERYLIIVMGFPYRQCSASCSETENRVRLLLSHLTQEHRLMLVFNTSVIIGTRTKNVSLTVRRIDNNNKNLDIKCSAMMDHGVL